MNAERIKVLSQNLNSSILIKKKENLLYLTGRSFMRGYLLVKPINTDRKRINTDKHQMVFFGDGLEKPPGIHSDILKNVGMYLGRHRVLQLEDEFTFVEYDYIKRKVLSVKRKVKLQHTKSPVDYQRQIKDPDELGLIRTNMRMVEKVFGLIRKEIKRPRMTEIKIAAFIKKAGYKFGAEDVSFPPIVASGANAAIPHHVPSNKKLKAGEPIIIDFGYKYKNYCSDFTRTVFIKKVPLRLEMAYNQVEKAYNECVSLRVPSASEGRGNPLMAGEVYQKVVDVLAEKHLDKYFIHSLGHGTGLEIHELPNLSPKSKDILQNGMVFSIEPGVYIPHLGGIRIEDLIYLKSGKVEKFIDVQTDLKSKII